MNQPDTVTVGGKEYPLGRITARNGLKAAGLIIPHIGGLKPLLVEAAAMPRGRRQESKMGIAILMDVIKVLGPLLDPDTFLQIASAVTNIEVEVLADAPLEDVMTATLTGLVRLDVVAILTAGMALFGQAQRLAAPEIAPAEEAPA